MTDLTELNKLESYLKEHGVNYVRIDKDDKYDEYYREQLVSMEQHQIIVFANGKRQWDAICHRGSYGHEEGLLEIMGTIVNPCGDRVEGWLTADDIISRLEGKK